MTLEERINDGLQGKYQGLSNGLDRINDYIFGIQRGCYYLLGGQSGTFKTSLADFMIFNAIQDADSKGISINIYYYSFEIDALTKKCIWLSTHIYKKHGMIIPPEKIKGLGRNRLTQSELAIVQAEMPYIESIFSRIKFTFESINPTGIYNTLWKEAESRGTIEYETIQDKDKIVKKIKKYHPNNPEEYNIIVLDHLYLLRKERGYDAKEVIDKYSEYCVTLRNIFGYSILNIQQFNDGLSTVDRQKFRGVDLSPQQNDFKDTRNPFQDADVVLGTMNPYKLDMQECIGYDVNRLGRFMIMLKVIKNRLSEDNIMIGLFINPKAGLFKELPSPNNITKMNSVYSTIEKLYNEMKKNE